MKEYAKYFIRCRINQDQPMQFAKYIEIEITDEKEINSNNVAEFIKHQIINNIIQIPEECFCIYVYEQWFYKNNHEEEVISSNPILADLIYVGKKYTLDEAKEHFGDDSSIVVKANKLRADIVVESYYAEEYAYLNSNSDVTILDENELTGGSSI